MLILNTSSLKYFDNRKCYQRVSWHIRIYRPIYNGAQIRYSNTTWWSIPIKEKEWWFICWTGHRCECLEEECSGACMQLPTLIIQRTIIINYIGQRPILCTRGIPISRACWNSQPRMIPVANTFRTLLSRRVHSSHFHGFCAIVHSCGKISKWFFLNVR